MSKELFDVLVQTKEAVYDKLNEDDKRYIDRQILERRLEGNSHFILKSLNL